MAVLVDRVSGYIYLVDTARDGAGRLVEHANRQCAVAFSYVSPIKKKYRGLAIQQKYFPKQEKNRIFRRTSANVRKGARSFRNRLGQKKCYQTRLRSNPHYSAHPYVPLVVPIGVKRIHKHSSRKPALLNRHYRGITTVSPVTATYGRHPRAGNRH